MDLYPRASATYTNLPAGTYTFLVKATDNDGVWSVELGQSSRLWLHPPFWWSLPAKILYLLLIGYAIVLVHAEPVEN